MTYRYLLLPWAAPDWLSSLCQCLPVQTLLLKWTNQHKGSALNPTHTKAICPAQ